MQSSRRNQRGSQESYIWPLVALVLVILPQVLVPGGLAKDRRCSSRHRGAVFLVLLGVAAKPGPVPRGARPLVLSLFAVLVVANTAAAARLVALVLEHPQGDGAAHGDPAPGRRRPCSPPTSSPSGCSTGSSTAADRAAASVHSGPYPDFQFPQTGTEGLAPPGWQPRFPDHLYLAFTNVVAFSPTDTLPLTHRVKGLMAIQSMISLAVLVVVISRVINILPP